MTVQCPRCRTQYKIPSARISDPRPVFKCTRCSLVFSSEAERGPRATARGKDDKSLPLPFASRKERPAIAGEDDPTVQSEPDLLDEPADDDGESAEDGEESAADEESEGGEEESDDGEEEDEETEPVRPARRERPATKLRATPKRGKEAVEEPAFVTRAARERERTATPPPLPPPRRNGGKRTEFRLRDEDEDLDDGPSTGLRDEDEEPRRPVLSASEGKQRRPPINPRRGIRSASGRTDGRSPLRPVTLGVAAIAVVYLGFAVALARRPEAAIETLSQVPLLGSLLGGDHLLVWRLQLTDVDGGLDQIKGGRAAYVVSGRALNTTNEDLRVIEIEGRLLANGVEQRRQTVYAANQQRKTIQDLSPSEVEMLLRLEPNRRFVIRPGESASFLLVFPNPPPDTTEVTCRVVNARAT